MIERNEELIDHLSTLLEYVDTHASAEAGEKIFDELERISLDLKEQRRIFGSKTVKPPAKKVGKHESGLILKQLFSNYSQRFEEDNVSILTPTGRGFSQKDTAFITFSLDTLAALHGLQFMFFGKILALENDYYVAVTCPLFNQKSYEQFQVFDPKSWKDSVSFLNSFRFFVTNVKLESQWKELPQILPKHVRMSRECKTMFSGCLDKDLNEEGFKGCEGEYLRAQLLRIFCATFAVPKGVHKVMEAEPEAKNEGLKGIGYDEEAKAVKLGIEEAMNPESWVHVAPSLLKSGQFYHFVEPKGRSEEQLTEQREMVETKDPPAELLSPISADVNTPWKAGIHGSKSSLCAEDELAKPQAVITIESTTWPGSLNFYSLELNRWCYLYVGFGVKTSQSKLKEQTQPVNEEPKMKREQKEPNFVEEPPKEEEPAPEPGAEDTPVDPESQPPTDA